MEKVPGDGGAAFLDHTNKYHSLGGQVPPYRVRLCGRVPTNIRSHNKLFRPRIFIVHHLEAPTYKAISSLTRGHSHWTALTNMGDFLFAFS